VPFEAEHSDRTRAAPELIWPLWADPSRWGDWDERIERAELESGGAEGGLAVGAVIAVKLRRGGTTRYDVVDLEPGRALTTEVRFPGARFGHERRVESSGAGATITHRLYLDGPLWLPFALMLGRGRLRKSVVAFAERERALVEPHAPHKPRKRRR
jgi:Polyketide cyclase / dehydrase and lipid transport